MEPNQKTSNRIKPLIDADMLRYEVGFGVQFKENSGLFIHKFDAALELLDHKINIILEETWATEPPTLYLTEDSARVERILKRGGQAEYFPIFREDLAVTKPYKGNRTSEKPFHYHNLTEYMVNHYDCKIAAGIEADDLLSIDQNLSHPDYDTVICSRDKDLRITPGKHYTWACGKNPSLPVYEVDKIGVIEPPEKNKVFGTGLKFFYMQLLTGDSVDNIPGIPRKGPAFAYKLLKDCATEEEMFDKVFGVYLDYVGDEEKAKEYFQEQADLLWIIQEIKDDVPVFYNVEHRGKGC